MSAPFTFCNAERMRCSPALARHTSAERETGGWETAAWATVKLAETEGFEPSIRL
jgi:hypothetical protein